MSPGLAGLGAGADAEHLASKNKALPRRRTAGPFQNSSGTLRNPPAEAVSRPVRCAREHVDRDRAGTPGAPDRGARVPDPAAVGPRPPAAPRFHDQLAAGARPDSLRLPALDRADPRLAAHVRGAR